mmetsp:Transcript_7100/g.22112  ORF Transcript_7100/g.22112 Transcript_7100/m.22112 type:complete len:252 (+) Transcript_7100:819-1574(+)
MYEDTPLDDGWFGVSCKSLIKFSIVVEAIGSKPAVGSSYMTTSSILPVAAVVDPMFSLLTISSLIIALANAARFFIPPESCAGYLSSDPANPTAVKDSPTIFLISDSGKEECSYKRKPTFSPTVNESNNAALWKTIPTFKLGFFSSDAKPSRFLPLMMTSPESGKSNPAMTRSTVDLPVPEGPIIPTASPRLIFNDTPSNTFLLPNCFRTSLSSIKTSSSLILSLLLYLEALVYASSLLLLLLIRCCCCCR